MFKATSAMVCAAALLSAACSSSERGEADWALVHENLPGALMSVWGASATDVWVVGADDGSGPWVLHYDGAAWTRKATGATGDLWWVHGFDGGPVYMGGKGGLILRYEDGEFTRLSTPGVGTVFGVWGATPDDMWAVGGGAGGSGGGFAWRLDGDTWALAEGFPDEVSASNVVWKIFGRAADDVWMVGTNGLALRWDGTSLQQVPSGTTRSLFTVHANGDRFVAVGGYGTGTIVENDGAGWVDVSSLELVQVAGVYLSDDDGYAVGLDGAVFRRGADGWTSELTRLAFYDQLHAVWIDPDGGVWAAGGQTASEPLIRGALIYKGTAEIPGGTYVQE